MRVTVNVFASLRQRLGRAVTIVELPAEARAAEAFAAVFPTADEAGRWRPATRIAVNGAYVAPETPLHDGDDVALIPPVAGG